MQSVKFYFLLSDVMLILYIINDSTSWSYMDSSLCRQCRGVYVNIKLFLPSQNSLKNSKKIFCHLFFLFFFFTDFTDLSDSQSFFLHRKWNIKKRNINNRRLFNSYLFIYSFKNLFLFISFFFLSKWYKHQQKSSSSSSSYRAGSTDIPDPLSPLLPIVHRPR